MMWVIQYLFSFFGYRDYELCGIQQERSVFSAIFYKKSVKVNHLLRLLLLLSSFLKCAIHSKRTFHPPLFHPFPGLFFDSKRK